MAAPIAFLSLAAVVSAVGVGSDTAESHPSLSWSECSGAGSCSEVSGSVVIDANWRWTHNADGYENCYDGNVWTDVCSSGEDCSEICVLEGADYSGTYGVSTSGDALTLNFVTEHAYGTNVGSRVYLMNEDDTTYQMFTLKGNEFAFDVDLSTVECGLNSALYFVPMEADGGMGSFPSNTAGAEYGTGYCDAQCARDLKWIGDVANIEGWDGTDDNSGIGNLGACCAEIDVWESNAYAFALTPHACEQNEYRICDTDDCGGTYAEDRYGGNCDADGCDYNPYRMGNQDFYGAGLTLDTSKVFTVVTTFDDNLMTQFFVQDGQRIDIPAPTFDGFNDSANIDPDFCTANFEVFDERNRFEEVGGWTALNTALDIPMVLVMSIWSDNFANMLWLDSTYPIDEGGNPGADRGPCATDSGDPAEVIEQFPDAHVVWSNIRFGPIGSTTGM